MNICFFERLWPDGGGIETVTRLLSNELAICGHNVYIAYFHDCNIIGYDVQRVKTCKLPNEKETETLRNFLIKQNINILINNHSHVKFFFFCKKACSETSIKLIHCLHTAFYISCPPINNIYKKVLYTAFPKLYERLKIWLCIYKQNKIYNQADAYILLSQRCVEQYKRFVPNKNLEHLFVIPNPLTYTITQPINLSKKEKILLFVGRIEEIEKRISMIIYFWRNIHNKYKDWSLVIVGDGSDMQITKELASNLPRVQFEGFKEPKGYYEKASIFLMTSLAEGFGMTLLEAQQNGCVPVAMDSYLTLHDIIENNKNGFIAPNNDISAFAEKVCQLMDNQDLRENMARNGIEYIKKFSIENIIPQWEKLFKEIYKNEET